MLKHFCIAGCGNVMLKSYSWRQNPSVDMQAAQQEKEKENERRLDAVKSKNWLAEQMQQKAALHLRAQVSQAQTQFLNWLAPGASENQHFNLGLLPRFHCPELAVPA